MLANIQQRERIHSKSAEFHHFSITVRVKHGIDIIVKLIDVFDSFCIKIPLAIARKMFTSVCRLQYFLISPNRK